MLSIKPLLAFAALALTTSASNCNTHQLYCGKTLKASRGWTNNEIQSKCLRSTYNDGQYPSINQIDKSLFKCGSAGDTLVWINGRVPCGRCVDGGAGNPDYCA
ncbi:hypothetical protein COCC4DRAFT_137230 [Bipolaris maydis ATCC 48331]|uniref:Uncharacterized protein n=2 Tax=Cochliobolus heterostrophus TaxID=5016 RepID=M2TQ01_COCH5|nr:uncharacterized protein COCC4DRAFT_137230 [Bipolaris maydis ATCC 48331]EMD88644.1 hypothetical protein COCHEDRAFT_1110461 [Bipolaris maydis C5]KAH7556693.1 hypothetical protein BM1_06127 [Bipolaris maydis]ENI05639.1 hypothetical protein COCC4DRAFT_137230 [Bipolaris maydis ATCC 48331]KAJ5028758.1 hypothetical protein J3E73DRAFT_34448 [Bipolaris maydis]KAJ5063549.1 hypothetical protein J3E74DRAFT_403693 [Bipolaris maydis]